MRFRQVCIVALFSSELINVTYTSIAGVSYRDDFDFEERYAKNQCQEGPPVFWYLGSVPILPQVVPQVMPQVVPQVMPQMVPQFHIEFEETETTTTQRVLSPFEALFDSFKRDISKEPVAPTVEMTKELGKVHVYRQPVSYDTMKMIQKLTNAYVDAMT